MNINDYLVQNRDSSGMAKHVRCKDGFRVSVQTSQFHYCLPREDVGPWTHVELGFPSLPPPEYMMEFCEDPQTPTQTVYARVPVELVDMMIEEHGGYQE